MGSVHTLLIIFASSVCGGCFPFLLLFIHLPLFCFVSCSTLLNAGEPGRGLGGVVHVCLVPVLIATVADRPCRERSGGAVLRSCHYFVVAVVSCVYSLAQYCRDPLSETPVCPNV